MYPGTVDASTFRRLWEVYRETVYLKVQAYTGQDTHVLLTSPGEYTSLSIYFIGN